MRSEAVFAALLAAALAGAACSGTTRVGGGPKAPAGARPGGSSSAAGTGFDQDRFHELLLAGRFAEARTALAAAHHPPPRAGRAPGATAPPLPADEALAAADAWLRIAERDWRHHVVPVEVEIAPPPAANPPSLLEAGLAAAHDAWPGGDPGRLGKAHRAADALEERGTTESRLFQAVVLAAVAAAQEERELLRLMLTQAQDLEWELREAERPLPASFQVARFAGDFWLQVHRYADARYAFLSATDREPRDARAWLGLARAEAGLGNTAASLEAYRTFVQRWAGANPVAEELAEARAAIEAAHE